MHPDDASTLEILGAPVSEGTALDALTSPIPCWFRSRYGQPTDAQRLAWPAIAAGKNLLLIAPTGTGKTLAALLPLLAPLLDNPIANGIRGVFVAPLKALVNDAKRNLQRHIAELERHLNAGQCVPSVASRTGDTDSRSRQKLWAEPPDILLTTPESLAVLLAHPRASDLFCSLCWIVVDEVHAMAGSKRGADLAVSLERLTRLSSDKVQRVGLSATTAPLAESARFLVGTHRPCAIAQVREQSTFDIRLALLEESPRFLVQLLDQLGPELRCQRSTLIFTQTRAWAERVSWALRYRYPEWESEIAVHHSAVGATRRREIERHFKEGRLRAVVCSSTLELGIDIGSVDFVVLVHPPGGAVKLVQRIGRSGHRPGLVRRGVVFADSCAELLEAAVTTASGIAMQHEPLRVAEHPLDVLCQQLLGMAATDAWRPDDAFNLVRQAYPYHKLSRTDFDACLHYLCGGGGPVGWLPSRLRWEHDSFTLASESLGRLVRRNLGTIVGEDPCAVKTIQAGSVSDGEVTELIGDVDQGFAERLNPGDRFLLDGKCLEFRRFDGGTGPTSTILVDETPGRPAVPRWNGDGWPMSAELARRLFLTRIQLAETLRDGDAALVAQLHQDLGLDAECAAVVVHYIERQERESEVPACDSCLIEATRTDVGVDYYIHAPLNRAAGDAASRAVVLRLIRDRGCVAIALAAELGFMISVRGGPDLSADDWRELLAPTNFAEDLGEAIAESVTLRERFQRVATTGFMLLRNPIGGKRRVGGRDWGGRQLFEQVRERDPQFPLLRQAEREVREEVCDEPATLAWLEGLPSQLLRCRWLPGPSPFVEHWMERGRIAPPSRPTEADDALLRLHEAISAAVS